MPHAPICVKCKREMEKIKSSIAAVTFVEGEPELGISSITEGDLFQCPSCEELILSDFGKTVDPYMYFQGDKDKERQWLEKRRERKRLLIYTR